MARPADDYRAARRNKQLREDKVVWKSTIDKYTSSNYVGYVNNSKKYQYRSKKQNDIKSEKED